MDRNIALVLLGLGPDATLEDVEQAYWQKCTELADRIRIAPTSDLKAIYREELERIEEARAVLVEVMSGEDTARVEKPVPVEPPPPSPPPSAAPPPPPPPPPATPVTPPPREVATPPQQRIEPREPPKPSALSGRVIEAEGAISDIEAAVGFLEGRVLLNRYEIRRRLGIGPHGAVYAGFDRRAGKEVAVKAVFPSLIEEPGVRETFLKDARVASFLSHPNIASVFDVHQEGPLHFLTMELLRGRSLGSIMEEKWRSRHAFPLPDVQELGATVCNALHYAHQYIVHGNIKPENIYFEPDGTIKVTDFGLAKLVERALAAGAEPTPYVAPEQRHGKPVSHHADQYSLAVILYEMLAAQVPATPPHPIHTLRSEVPPEMSIALARALQGLPETRFPDQAAFGRALVVRTAGRGISPTAWMAGAGLMAVLLAGGIIWYWRVQVNEERVAQELLERQAREQAALVATQTAIEVERAATAEAAAEAVRTAAQARVDAERTAIAARQEADRLARERAEATARAEALIAPATRAAAEVERVAMEARLAAERNAATRAALDVQRTQTARAKREADRVETARAEAEAARIATAEAEGAGQRQATERARREAERQATQLARREADRVATQRAEVEAQRTATALRAELLARKEGYIPSIDATVTSLRFFEQGAGQQIPEGERRYSESFDREETRFVFWELALSHPPQGTRRPFRIRSICRRPDGRVFGEGVLDTYVEANWGRSTHVYGWGFNEADKWERGRYQVEIYVEEKRVVRGSFRID